MYIYSFTSLFKHAVIISDYMASNDTMNDEQWIESNEPANVTVQFHVLPQHLTGHQNETTQKVGFAGPCWNSSQAPPQYISEVAQP